jgi:hypothetical protein
MSFTYSSRLSSSRSVCPSATWYAAAAITDKHTTKRTRQFDWIVKDHGPDAEEAT